MANHKTRDIPGRILKLQAWEHGREISTRELASILKEEVQHVASALSRMKTMGLVERTVIKSRAYWRPANRGRNPALSMPFLRPSGYRLLYQLEADRG